MYLGASEIQYGDIVLGLTFTSAVVHISGAQVHKGVLFCSSLLILSILLGILSLINYPPDVMVIGFNNSGGWDAYLRGELSNLMPVSYSFQSILMLLRVCFFTTILIVAKSVFSFKDWMRVLDLLTFIAKILVIFGFLEIFIRLIFNFDLNLILNDFFGRGISTGGGISRLQGLSREPSMYALVLFNMMILFLVSIKVEKNSSRDIFWIFCILFIGAMANSFSFLVSIFSFLILVSAITSSGKGTFRLMKFYLFGITTGTFILIFLTISWWESTYLFQRIIESITQAQNGISRTYVIGVDYGSEASRIIGMLESFRSFLARPILGLGLGTTYCVSGFVSILANIGLLGLIIWIRLLTVHYYRLPNILLVVGLFSPILVTNDLGVLYDTAYLALVPLIFLVTRKDQPMVAVRSS
jgi:hypothetical protein